MWIDATTKIPLAVKVGQIQEHETHRNRALVTQARANLAGHARLHKVVFDRGFLDGTDLWWLDQQGLSVVVPAKTNMAVTADATKPRLGKRPRWAAGRTPCARGRGKPPAPNGWKLRWLGTTGLTTYDQYGTPEHERHANRRDFQPNPINAVDEYTAVEWERLWAWRHNRVSDQCPGGEALAGL